MNLLETFDNSHPDLQLQWLNEPASWRFDNKQLHVRPDTRTDFWQKTHYGFEVDNGHFLYARVAGDFIMDTRVHCDFKHQYDQAGLMVRISDQCWVKTSLEFEPNESNKLGVVVTNQGYSDWSSQDVDDGLTEFSLKIIRKGSDYIIQFLEPGSSRWTQLRMFHLFDHDAVMAGLYACSPKNASFSTRFDYLSME